MINNTCVVAGTADPQSACRLCDPARSTSVYSPVENGTTCSDGNPCNGSETCQSGLCTAGIPVACTTPPPCRTAAGATCDRESGSCAYPALANNTSCSDGDACNGLETCQNGSCVAGTPVACNAPPPCHTATGATCDAQTGACSYPAVANNTSCSDGDACNGVETCENGACKPGTPVLCNAPPICHTGTGARCNRETGVCNYPAVANNTSCSDGNACNGGETCQNGACAAGNALNCDDANPCTADSCVPDSGCRHTAVADGTQCGSTKQCKASACVDQTAMRPRYKTTGTSCFNCASTDTTPVTSPIALLLAMFILYVRRRKSR